MKQYKLVYSNNNYTFIKVVHQAFIKTKNVFVTFCCELLKKQI